MRGPEASVDHKAGGAAGRYDGWWCAAVFVLAAVAARPFVEMGLVDDFSYVKTAFDYARTGHFAYNGWATAMLGWQVLWGALFVKLLGATFFATRVSTLVVAAASVLCTHAVLVRCGIHRRNAVFGALTLAVSPLFLPLSITFLTDVGGFAVIVLCLYCCLRALRSASDRSVLLWLAAGNLVGLLGGSSRQISWLTVLVMLPATAWLLRDRRGVPGLAVTMWLTSLVAIALTLRWFAHQPYSVPEHLIQPGFHLKLLRELAGTMVAAALCLLVLLLPLLVAGVAVLRRKALALAGLAAGAVLMTVIARMLTFHLAQGGYFPWAGDTIDRLDIVDYPNAWMVGVTPSTFTAHGRVIASVVVLFCALAFLAAMLRKPNQARLPLPRLTWRQCGVLLGPFTAAYVLLLVPRGLWAEILDRYLLPLIVVALIVLLRLYQERVSPRLPAVAYAALAVMGLFTVAGTHDWIASHRARLEAVATIEASGVPRDQIAAGYEFDGWTQIAEAGAVYDPRVTYPAGFRVDNPVTPTLRSECRWLLNPHTPLVQARYVLSHQPDKCLRPSGFGVVTYRAWLPPFHREILIGQPR